MKRYLYILIIISIFLCVCLFCKGCIDIYENFSVGGQVSDGINISQNLILNSSGSDFNCSKEPTPDTCNPSDYIVCQNCNTTKTYIESNPKYPDMSTVDNDKFHIRVKNTSNIKIMLWLDDLPFSPSWITDKTKKNVGNRMTQDYIDKKPNLNRGMFTNIPNFSRDINGKIIGNNWKELGWKDGEGPIFRKANYINSKWDINNITDINRYFLLDVGEVLIITPPHGEIFLQKTPTEGIKPYQCNYQITECNSDVENDDWHGTCKNNTIDLTKYDWYNSLTNNNENNVIKNISKKYWSLNCGGSGMYITPCLPKLVLENIIDTSGLSRIEYNINGGQVFFNLSGVDGINSSINVSFTSSNTKNKCAQFYNRSCNIENIENKCPNKDGEGFRFKNEYIKSCVSPKEWHDNENDLQKDIYPMSLNKKLCNYSNTNLYINASKIRIYDLSNIDNKTDWNDTIIPNDSKINNLTTLINYLNTYGGKNVKSEINASNIDNFFAKCPVKDAYGKALCHIWWDDPSNECSKTWRDFIEIEKTCQQYTWAYDETRIIESMFSEDKIIPFDENGNPLKSDPNTWDKNPDGTIKIPPDYQSVNSIIPLLNCSIKDLTGCVYIDIEISNVLSDKLKYNSEDIELCNNILGNNSVYPQCVKNALYSGSVNIPDNFECSDGTKFIFNNSTLNNMQSCLSNVPSGIEPIECDSSENGGNGATTCTNYEEILQKSPCIWKDHTLCGHDNFNTKNNKYCYPKKPQNLNYNLNANICTSDSTYEKCNKTDNIWCEPGHYGINLNHSISDPIGPIPAPPCPSGCSECCNPNVLPKQNCKSGNICPESGCCDGL